MRYLLDTHTFIWWVSESRRLPERVRSLIEDAENEIHLSVISVIEIAIKVNARRIVFEGDPQELISAQLASNQFMQLPVEMRHAMRMFALPPIHRDPFDRLLVAQAQVDDLVLLSHDASIRQYDVPVLW